MLKENYEFIVNDNPPLWRLSFDFMEYMEHNLTAAKRVFVEDCNQYYWRRRAKEYEAIDIKFDSDFYIYEAYFDNKDNAIKLFTLYKGYGRWCIRIEEI